MNREEARNYINGEQPTFLDEAKRISGKPSYVCPVCGNGTGRDATGITLDPKSNHYHCFKCGLHEDVVGLYGLANGLTDSKDIFEGVYRYYGIDPTADRTEQKRTNRPMQKQEPATDYSPFLLQAKEAVNYDYLKSRGISEEVQDLFRVGTASNGNIIIPFGNNTGYLERATTSKFYKNTGAVSITNIELLTDPNAKTVFVVEGAIDAMSIYEAGGQAIALNSAGNYKKLVEYLQANDCEKVFVLMFDNDLNRAGQQDQEKLAQELKKMGVAFVEAHLEEYNEHDPNEFLQNRKADLEGLVLSLKADADKARTSNQYNALELLDYFKHIEEQPESVEIKTGFAELDRLLFGGLHEGLYFIGAISSLGKTTFTLQVADQIAGTGQDVIFFSLEMSKYELIAKSISRHTYKIARHEKTADGHYIAKETQGIINNRLYKNYTQEERDTIAQAIRDYEAEAKHLYIYEGRYKGQKLTAQHIRDIVKAHVEKTGRTPVVFVDYLQIIEAPEGKRMDDKQKADFNVYELKEISRDFKTPVIAISSFNRESYNRPVTMASFKESGGVEYSSDVLIGLQFGGMNDNVKESEVRDIYNQAQTKKRNKEEIAVDLKVLKNRNGYQFTTSFYMMPAFNCFEQRIGVDAWQKAGVTPFDKKKKVY